MRKWPNLQTGPNSFFPRKDDISGLFFAGFAMPVKRLMPKLRFLFSSLVLFGFVCFLVISVILVLLQEAASRASSSNLLEDLDGDLPDDDLGEGDLPEEEPW